MTKGAQSLNNRESRAAKRQMSLPWRKLQGNFQKTTLYTLYYMATKSIYSLTDNTRVNLPERYATSSIATPPKTKLHDRFAEIKTIVQTEHPEPFSLR